MSPVRSDLGFVSPMRSDPVRSDPGFVNGPEKEGFYCTLHPINVKRLFKHEIGVELSVSRR